MASTTTLAPTTLRKELSLFDGMAIVVGTVIGSGIFLIPSAIAEQLHSLGAVMLAWIVGGALSVFGALSLAELGGIYPGTGGLCTYLRRAYGPLPAFLYAWELLLIIHSGSIAALAVGVSLYVGQVVPMSGAEQRLLSAGLVLVLTAINAVGIRSGKLVQNLIATAKIGGLGGMIVLLAWKGPLPLHFLPPSGAAVGGFTWAAFGVALVAILWAYEGWHVVSFVGGEMKNPQRDLPRSLAYGTAFVLAVYLTANLCYYHVLTADEIRGSSAVAALAVGRLLGPAAGKTLAILILISVMGSLNGLVLTGPRVYYAMAHDGALPRIFGQISDKYRTPMLALLVQGAWSAVLAASGSYKQLFTDVIFTAWIFYGSAVAAVIVLRRRKPELERPFRVPGYPWLPVFFCAAALGLVVSTIFGSPQGALVGFGTMAVGLPVYYYLVRGRGAAPSPGDK